MDEQSFLPIDAGSCDRPYGFQPFCPGRYYKYLVSNGPTGQVVVQDVVIDPIYTDTLYAGTMPGTVYRSLNRGGSWLEIGASIGGTVSALAINPLNSAVVYAGTQHAGVYKTVDRGATWAKVNTGLVDMLINVIAIDPVDTNRVFAGSSDSVFVTVNGGTRWSSTGLDSVNVSDIALNPLAPDTAYVATNGKGIYRTFDGGSSWTQVNSGLGSLRVSELAVHPTHPEIQFAVTFDGGLYKTENHGNNWAISNNGLPTLNLSSVAIAPGNPSVVFVAASSPVEIYKSSDGGATWSDISLNISMAVGPSALVVHPDSSNVVYAAVTDVQRLKQTGLDTVGFLETDLSPRALIGADFNNDGQVDFVAANQGSNTLSVFLTLARGSLFQRTDYRAGSGPSSVRAADLDLDGDLDLVTVNRTKETISVLHNDSTGVFSLPVDYFIGEPASLLAVADLDGDQDKDIVAGDSGVGSLRVFLNDGGGSLESPTIYPVSQELSGLHVGDFTGNGLPDLAAVSRITGELTLLVNTGNSRFVAQEPVAAATNPVYMVGSDFDLDGNLDLCLITVGRRVVMLLNEGSGRFTPSTVFTLSDTATGMAVADVDQDKYADLLVPESNGTVRALVNDGNARFTSTITLGSVAGPGGVLGADLDGDSRQDVVVTQPGSNGLVVLANNTLANIKSPAVPRNLRATDRGGDLGGNIDLTWDRALVDETTGRITGYRVFRSSVESGPYVQIAELDTNAAHSQDTNIVFRTYTDSSATVGESFYYYVVSENSTRDFSAHSDTATATSKAQPFFELVFSESTPFHIRDTIDVQVRLNPVGHDVQSISLYMDYDVLAFRVLDKDPLAIGTQPFTVDSSLVLRSRVLQNRLEAGGSGQVSYGLGFLPELPDEPFALGSIQVVALKDTTTQIQVVRDPSSIRRSALTERSGGDLIQPYIPPANNLVLKNHRIRGSVTFQGRRSNYDQDARLDLTRSDSLGSGLPLPDSLAYRPPNDVDFVKRGIQMRLDTKGQFSLVQVPAGTYGLFIKTFHYLRGRVAGDSVVVNDTTGVVTPVTFQWLSSDGRINSSELRAGDANDDNRADLADFGLLSAQFGQSVFEEDSAAWAADFNGDSIVNLADFALLQSNFGEVGMGSSILSKPVVTDVIFTLNWESPGKGVVHIENVDDVAGFALDIVVPAGSDVRPEQIRVGRYVDAAGKSLLLVRELKRGSENVFRVGVVLRNPLHRFSEGGDLIYLEGDLESRSHVRLENFQVLSGDGTLSYGQISELHVPTLTEEIPEHPELSQNMPNPFNPATVIPFAVSEAALVRLEVYSILGQEIRSLVSKHMPAGFHRVIWDGRDNWGRETGSGIYLYRIQIGRFVDVKKSVLIR
ncbi:MAG: hypothetical protein CME25_21130 [Gemmatimonadetes bacterium]|nr:hypothetical protein [Gemmatimonadota bacterium]